VNPVLFIFTERDYAVHSVIDRDDRAQHLNYLDPVVTSKPGQLLGAS
jgi:hypothetical protein